MLPADFRVYIVWFRVAFLSLSCPKLVSRVVQTFCLFGAVILVFTVFSFTTASKFKAAIIRAMQTASWHTILA